MNREEAEKRANELLSHYGKQNWDEHFKTDVPTWNQADHILVKNADELIAMLQRRGYTVIGEQGAGVYGKMYSVQCADEVCSFASDAFLYERAATVAERLDQWVGAGQHHMQHECGFPLLREAKNAGSRETLAYRAAHLGPTSESLLECPQCQQYVQDDSVQEIEDV